MLARHTLAAVAFAALIPAQAHAQSAADLVREGRFDEAAALVVNAGPQERSDVARLIFDQAYTSGHQSGDYEYAIRGFTAGKRLVSMSDPMYEQLSFWHGFALFNAAVREAAAQTLASAELTLPMFEQAMELFASAGDYPARVNVNMTQLLENADTYIEIQEAVIRRGR